MCYGPPVELPLPGSVSAGTIADIDGDGNLDVAVMTQGSDGYSLTFAINDGRGGLKVTAGLKFPMTPTAIEAGDINGDGYVDLVIAAIPGPGQRDAPGLHILLGRGRGQFIAGTVETRIAAGGLWLTDVTGDAQLDILALASKGQDVEVLIGDGRGEFTAGPRQKLPGTVTPAGLTLGDFNLDKRLDLAFVFNRGSKAEAIAAIATGDGRGKFKLAARRVIGHQAQAIVAADFNRDGVTDLAALAHATPGPGSSPTIVALLSDGRLGSTAISYFGPTAVHDATLADLDRNGTLDIIASSMTTNTAELSLGDGRGGFGELVRVPMPAGTSVVHVADLDRDGRPELVGWGVATAKLSTATPRPCR